MLYNAKTDSNRAVGRSENPGVPVVIVEIGLTDLPKSGCAMAHPGTPRDDRPDMYWLETF